MWLLAHRGRIHDDPIVATVRDPTSYLIGRAGLALVLYLRALACAPTARGAATPAPRPRTCSPSSGARTRRASTGCRAPMLPYACGRSYGDSCLNDGGVLLDVRRLDRLIAFDATEGVLRCEAGVTLAEILALVVPRGWFLPVVPGTRWVSVGGAIANDIHGKNHHRAGSFGAHVTRLELLRSSGERVVCAPGDAAVSCDRRRPGPHRRDPLGRDPAQAGPGAGIALERIRFRGLDGFFALAAEDQALRVHRGLGRLPRARAAAWGAGSTCGATTPPTTAPRPRRSGRPASGYRWTPRQDCSIGSRWDSSTRPTTGHSSARSAGPRRHTRRSFFRSTASPTGPDSTAATASCSISASCPRSRAAGPIRSIFDRISRSGEPASLAVLKRFGDLPSPGLLSFARPGLTLAVDFPVRGRPTFALLDELDAIVRDAGGAVYPAKDARMSPESFRAYLPGPRPVHAAPRPQVLVLLLAARAWRMTRCAS